MNYCKFKNCNNKFIPVSTRKTITHRLKQVYCKDCVDEKYQSSGTPNVVTDYGGVLRLWELMLHYCKIFNLKHNEAEMRVNPNVLLMPKIKWNTRLHRIDKEHPYTLYGTADISNWSIDVYIRRADTVDRLLDTVIHEMTHFIMYEVFNEPLDLYDGHTKMFWKFLFEFSEFIGFAIPMRV